MNNRRVLREWETSNDVSEIYKYINKNKKFIQQKIKDSNYSIGSGSTRLIQPDNLVLILKGVIPNNNLSLTQWKMIVNVAKKDTLDGLIDLNEFFRLMEVTTKKMTSHPSIITKKKLPKLNKIYKMNHGDRVFNSGNCDTLQFESGCYRK